MIIFAPPAYIQSADSTSRAEDAIDLSRINLGNASDRPRKRSWELGTFSYTSEPIEPGLTVVFDFISQLARDSKDLDPEVARAIDEDFWDLL